MLVKQKQHKYSIIIRYEKDKALRLKMNLNMKYLLLQKMDKASRLDKHQGRRQILSIMALLLKQKLVEDTTKTPTKEEEEMIGL